jgi:hypothetical protein
MEIKYEINIVNYKIEQLNHYWSELHDLFNNQYETYAVFIACNKELS